MNYYRRYCGDYAAATPHLTLLEHGAYALMLDAYYTSERPLPASYELLYRICRAQLPAEKKAVRQVAEEFFPVSADGEYRHNARADKELSIAIPKMAKLREVARENGKKGGNPKKKAEYNEPGTLYAFRIDDARIKVGISKHPAQRISGLRGKYPQGELVLMVKVEDMGASEAQILAEFDAFCDGEVLTDPPNELLPRMRQLGTQSYPVPRPNPAGNPQPDLASNPQPVPSPYLEQPPTTNHQPPEEPLSDYRFPGGEDIMAEPRTAGPAQPQVNPDAMARVVAECQRAKLEDASPENAIIARWIRNGATPTQVAQALSDARRSMPEPRTLKAGYVDTILVNLMQADQQARRNAEKSHNRTKAQIAEQQERAKQAAPIPEHLRTQKRRVA